MSALYALVSEYKEAADRLAYSGLDEQTIADTLDGLGGDIEQKAINIAKLARNIESEAEAIRKAVDEMIKRANAAEARADRLRKYLHHNLLQADIKKVTCPYFVIRVTATPAAVVIDDEKLIRGDLMTYPPLPPPKPNKRLIAETIKSGVTVPGAHLESGTRLEIR